MTYSPVLVVLLAFGISLPVTGMFIRPLISKLPTIWSYILGALLDFWQLMFVLIDLVIIFTGITMYPQEIPVVAKELMQIWNDWLGVFIVGAFIVHLISIFWIWRMNTRETTVSRLQGDVLLTSVAGIALLVIVYVALLASNELVQGLTSISR